MWGSAISLKGIAARRNTSNACLAVFVVLLSLAIAPAAHALDPQLVDTYRGEDYSLEGRFGQSITPFNDEFFLIGAPDKNSVNFARAQLSSSKPKLAMMHIPWLTRTQQ
jgi:hypothetical protein